MSTVSGTKKNDVFNIEYENNQNVSYLTSKGTDTININGLTDINKLKWQIDNNDIVITNVDNRTTIRLINYYKLNGKHSIKYLQLNGNEKFSILESDFVKNIIEIDGAVKLKNTSISGSNFNDLIDVSSYQYIPENRKGFSIKTGSGNDTIVGNYGNDSITGGVGFNTIVYTEEFDSPIVALNILSPCGHTPVTLAQFTQAAYIINSFRLYAL